MDRTTKTQACTNFRLRGLTRLVSRFYDSHLVATGLKTTQYSLLTHVMHGGPLRPTDLADRLNMDASTLTRNLKPMAAAGWLAQTEGVDARSRLVSITQAGQKKFAEAQRGWRSAQQELNSMLGTERVLQLHLLINESIELLRNADGACKDKKDSDE
ncbi:MarR family winged helix-turn-helix transcriptional regulator [Variovorax sp. J22G21]|uniref:MarR family winged helix-turn-helix transcriptional regulator n=1 Tax=Variovorax fucosicus TaxID=3053517 RepID=UPI0025767F9D|nr:MULTISPECIES: MarR family winged helix-turn-helix transcriptional regulator [unclassified Variovorax]MDM0042768.1 MarR family winged helix-turn-helix transcriptional regulator [Variovorax sp. J22R193]MDM0064837.1 MarR family winged helix-turn-helix transcriptional regulator [Variovorax sp. J22G21]